ncbi:MAG: tetratricopeptide repeat protein [bacterium]|nr:tetratricopeptide repeat protein [bacterium]
MYTSYKNADYLTAYNLCRNFLESYPTHKKASEVAFISATISMGMNQIVRAIIEYEEVYKKYPLSLRAADSLYMLGLIYEEYLKDKKTALKYYKELVKNYPHTFIAKETLKKLEKP